MVGGGSFGGMADVSSLCQYPLASIDDLKVRACTGLVWRLR
jgi:hypothetical protein